MPVLVAMRGRRDPALARRLGRAARRLLGALRLESFELSLVLVSDRVMHELNRRWRGKDRPTDVLAFPQRESAVRGRRARDATPTDALLGDVVISVDTARRQAAERNHSLATEAERLLVHGLLHLAGYDHERSLAEAHRMQRKERALLRALEPPGRRRAHGGTTTRAYPACRAGLAGRGTPVARTTERHTLAPPPDPRRSLGSA